MHWADEIAQKIVERFPNREKYVCAAGITPSGLVHIGNLRDVFTNEMVARALEHAGENAEFIWSWDDYDRFRKVPQNVPSEFEKYIGLPVCKVPDPFGCHDSYARHFEAELEEDLPRLGVKARIIRQSEMYEKNAYFEPIKLAMQKRKEIARILFASKAQNLGEDEVEKYYPLNIYCAECGRDTTWITSYDDKNLVSYECKCGFKETADISKKNIGKLAWRVDWPMRWQYEQVAFEAAGRDHMSAGSSAEVGDIIDRKVFQYEPPLHAMYEFLGLVGSTHKMSGSTGEALTPGQLLEIYEPEIIRWFFARVRPEQKFDFALDDQIIKNYSEWDEFLKKAASSDGDRPLVGSAGVETAPNPYCPQSDQKRVLEFSQITPDKIPEPGSISFRQLASFAQIAKKTNGKGTVPVRGQSPTSVNVEVLKTMIESAGSKISDHDLKERLPRAIAWTENYAPMEYRIKLLDEPNCEFAETLSVEQKAMVRKLVDGLEQNWSLEGLTNLIYEIPKKPELDTVQTKTAQREFFKILYRLLTDGDTGPRLPTFLLAIGQEKAKKLLKILK